jgi:hypothetical protein
MASPLAISTKQENQEMKKVVTTITAAIFALGLVSAGLAQTAQTPAKPEVKQESTTVQTPAAKPEAAKPEAAKSEVTKPEAPKTGEKPAAKEAVKPGEAKKETKEAKKAAKKETQKGKDEKKSGAPVEKSQPEKK